MKYNINTELSLVFITYHSNKFLKRTFDNLGILGIGFLYYVIEILKFKLYDKFLTNCGMKKDLYLILMLSCSFIHLAGPTLLIINIS